MTYNVDRCLMVNAHAKNELLFRKTQNWLNESINVVGPAMAYNHSMVANLPNLLPDTSITATGFGMNRV